MRVVREVPAEEYQAYIKFCSELDARGLCVPAGMTLLEFYMRSRHAGQTKIEEWQHG